MGTNQSTEADEEAGPDHLEEAPCNPSRRVNEETYVHTRAISSSSRFLHDELRRRGATNEEAAFHFFKRTFANLERSQKVHFSLLHRAKSLVDDDEDFEDDECDDVLSPEEKREVRFGPHGMKWGRAGGACGTRRLAMRLSPRHDPHDPPQSTRRCSGSSASASARW